MNLPNKLTVLRMCLIPVFLALFLLQGIPHHYAWALLVFAAASLTDLADGKIARSRGLVTDFGKLMDPLADKLLVMSAMVCFVAVGAAPAAVVVVVLAREFLVTAIRQIAAAAGTVLAADNWGKAKTVSQMLWICVGLLVLELGSGAYAWAERLPLAPVYQALMWIVVLLTAISGLRYGWSNRQLFRDR